MYDVLEDLPFLFTAHQRSEQQRPVYLRQISTQRRLVACSQVTPHGNFFVVDVALSAFLSSIMISLRLLLLMLQ